jgi:hypothetical protein
MTTGNRLTRRPLVYQNSIFVFPIELFAFTLLFRLTRWKNQFVPRRQVYNKKGEWGGSRECKLLSLFSIQWNTHAIHAHSFLRFEKRHLWNFTARSIGLRFSGLLIYVYSLYTLIIISFFPIWHHFLHHTLSLRVLCVKPFVFVFIR